MLPHARFVALRCVEREEAKKKHPTILLHFETDYTFSVNLCLLFGIEYLIMFVEVVFLFFSMCVFVSLSQQTHLFCLKIYSSFSITSVDIGCTIADNIRSSETLF